MATKLDALTVDQLKRFAARINSNELAEDVLCDEDEYEERALVVEMMIAQYEGLIKLNDPDDCLLCTMYMNVNGENGRSELCSNCPWADQRNKHPEQFNDYYGPNYHCLNWMHEFRLRFAAARNIDPCYHSITFDELRGDLSKLTEDELALAEKVITQRIADLYELRDYYISFQVDGNLYCGVCGEDTYVNKITHMEKEEFWGAPCYRTEIEYLTGCCNDESFFLDKALSRPAHTDLLEERSYE